MPRTSFRHAVIGLGGIGSAAADWLTRLGEPDEVLGLERFELGHVRGASHDHGRIIRLSYHTPGHVRLARLAYDAWEAISADAGEPMVVTTGGVDLFPPGASIAATDYETAMRGAGVPFEVVPGVPAAIGFSAYAGVPLTYPGAGDTITFIRGFEDDGKAHASLDIDWSALAHLDGTIVCYTGPSQLPILVKALLSHGRSAEEPAALVMHGTLATQRTTFGTLADIADVHRLTRRQVSTRLHEAGLIPVQVDGWAEPAWASPEALTHLPPGDQAPSRSVNRVIVPTPGSAGSAIQIARCVPLGSKAASKSSSGPSTSVCEIGRAHV